MNAALVALLLRVWVAEHGWSAELDDAATYHVLLRHAGTVEALPATVAQMVDAHSNAIATRPWLAELTADCAQPEHWPANRNWLPVVCVLMVQRAQDALAGKLRDPCHGRADQWRARKSKALRSALKRGYRRVGCGKTVNAFLREPK